MTKLSRLGLDPNDMGLYINNLWAVFTLVYDKKQVRALFKDLFTHTEYKMFAKRLEIARRRLNEQTYEQIKADLRVTEHTIRTVSNILERDGAGFRAAYRILTDLEKDYQKKRSKFQNQLEGRTRRKMASETFLADLTVAGFKQATKAVRKKIAKSSTKNRLDV
jgi:uncharacterized protein YerC